MPGPIVAVFVVRSRQEQSAPPALGRKRSRRAMHSNYGMETTPNGRNTSCCAGQCFIVRPWALPASPRHVHPASCQRTAHHGSSFRAPACNRLVLQRLGYRTAGKDHPPPRHRRPVGGQHRPDLPWAPVAEKLGHVCVGQDHARRDLVDDVEHRLGEVRERLGPWMPCGHWLSTWAGKGRRRGPRRALRRIDGERRGVQPRSGSALPPASECRPCRR